MYSLADTNVSGADVAVRSGYKTPGFIGTGRPRVWFEASVVTLFPTIGGLTTEIAMTELVIHVELFKWPEVGAFTAV